MLTEALHRQECSRIRSRQFPSAVVSRNKDPWTVGEAGVYGQEGLVSDHTHHSFPSNWRTGWSLLGRSSATSDQKAESLTGVANVESSASLDDAPVAAYQTATSEP